MSVSNATLMVGATVAATGGTSTTFVPNGADVKSGIQLVDSTNTNAVTRAVITLRTIKAAVFDAVKGIFTGKSRRSCQLVRPKVLASGQVVFPLIRIEVEDHPEMSDAERAQLRSEGAQILTDPDFTSFWTLGSIA